jgi:hypothetical protein
MSNQPFNNDTDQQTRRQILKDTYLSRTQADADLEAQGRFKKQSPTMIVGAQYPKQPANSPWAQGIDEIVGVEPPLGFEEFVGELGGASSASLPCAEENATPRGGLSSSASDNPPRFLRRRI